MNRVGVYLLTENLITDLPIRSEEDRLKVEKYYTIASSFLDESIEAWYKKLDRLDQPSPAEEWSKVLSTLLKCPWIVPIYRWNDPGSKPPSRSILMIRMANHILPPPNTRVEERTKDNRFFSAHINYGSPPIGTELTGFYFDMGTLSLDDDIYDFSLPSRMKDDYDHACSSILEMGGRHTRNVPTGGVIYCGAEPMLPFGMNRLNNFWNLYVRDGAYQMRYISRLFHVATTPSGENAHIIPVIALAPWTSVPALYPPLPSSIPSSVPSSAPRSHPSKPSTGKKAIEEKGEETKAETRPETGAEIKAEKEKETDGEVEMKEEPMEMVVRSIYWNLTQLLSATYLLSNIPHESDPLPPVRFSASLEPVKVERPPLRWEPFRASVQMENGALASLFTRALSIPIRPTATDRAKGNIRILRAPAFMSALQAALRDRDWWKGLVKSLFAKAAPHDLVRIEKLRRLIKHIRAVVSLRAKEVLLKKLKAEVKLDPLSHQYTTDASLRDSDAGKGEKGEKGEKGGEIVILCEHTMAELELVTKGEVDAQSIIANQYSKEGETLTGEDKPMIVTCRYCGADLGSDWLVMGIPTKEEIAEGTGTRKFLDESLGIITSKLVGSGAVTTQIPPILLIKSIYQLAEAGIYGETKKLKVSSTRTSKMRYIELAAVVAALHALAKAGAPLVINRSQLEAHITKEYLSIFQDLDLIAQVVIDKMIGYWEHSISKYFRDPEQVIKSVIYEILGLGEDKLLSEIVTRLLAYPIQRKREGKTEGETEVSKYYKEVLYTDKPPYLRFPVRRISNRYLDVEEVIEDLRLGPPTKPAERYVAKGEGMKDGNVFVDAIHQICPALLLSPVPPSEVFEPREETPFLEDNVLWSPIQLWRHIFPSPPPSIEARSEAKSRSEAKFRSEAKETEEIEVETKPEGKCKFCGISESYEVDDKYRAKYEEAVKIHWQNVIITPLSVPLPEKSGVDTSIADNEIDDSLMKEFEKEFQWKIPTSLTPTATDELSYLVSGIGNYSLGIALREAEGAEKRDPIFQKKIEGTVWNRVMKWAMKEKNRDSARFILSLMG